MLLLHTHRLRALLTHCCSQNDDDVDVQPFTPGNYSLQIFICDGQCGATAPNSGMYAQGFVNFTLHAK